MGIYSTESLGGLHTMQGTLSEVGRLKSEQMIACLGEEQPASRPEIASLRRFSHRLGPFSVSFRAEEWVKGGFMDLLLLVCLEPHAKELRIAADVAFTQPYGEAGPMAAQHFIRRSFLKRWRFLEHVEQDLKTGISLATLLRGAGEAKKEMAKELMHVQ